MGGPKRQQQHGGSSASGTAQQQPRGWPSEPGAPTYLPLPAPNPSMPRAAAAALSAHLSDYAVSLPALPVAPAAGPCPAVSIRPISDPSHPAHGQRGLFAARTLPGNSHVLDYCGLLSDAAHESSTSDYTLRLSPGATLDAETAGNEARFVNDYRGGARPAGPNCRFDAYRNAAGQARMGVFTLKGGVKKGDEMVVSYGKGYWQARGLLGGGAGGSYPAEWDGPGWGEEGDVGTAEAAGGGAEGDGDGAAPLSRP